MNFRLLAAALAAATLSAGAQAAVYTDDFNADGLGLNAVPAGWSVANGTVDVIGTGFFDLVPGNGNYIDLDGSSNQAGVLSHLVTGVADGTYTVSFQLAGNQRGAGNDVVDVTFGGTTQTYTLADNAPLATYTLTTNVSGGSVGLSFYNHGGDNQGAILDNVSVSAVPEPAGVALMLAGLGFVGFAAKRRKLG